jgi:PAS domain S-box-containing protein
MNQQVPNAAAPAAAGIGEVIGETDALFHSIFDFYGTLDLEGRVVRLAGRIFEKTNADPSLLVGQRFSETVFWQSSENTAAFLDRSVEQAAAGVPVDQTLDFRVSADEKLPVDIHLQRIESASGGLIFFGAKAVRNATSTATQKRDTEQLLSAAENAEIGLWFWDFDENKIYSTPRCNELLGIPTYESLDYERFLEVVHPEDRPSTDETLQQSRLDGTKYEVEFRVLCPDGAIEWICAEGKSFLGDDGQPQRMMGVLRKITDQRLAAEELERASERERNAREEAVEANRSKDFFLAFVSHELRSPLNAILGWSKILLTKKVDEATQRNALETIERSARVQTKLINDLVDSARVASGKLRLEYHPTDLAEVVRVSFEAQRPAAEQHKLNFELDAGEEAVPVFGDAGRLQQVFTNLMSNAIKFTPEGGTVTVTVKGGPDVATVSVKDTGHGISPETLPYIFRQFSQVETARSRNNVGLGLGLSIVKILVEKHGGTVRAESAGLGRGSEFTVTMPVSGAKLPEAVEQNVANAAHNPRPLAGLDILLVEDDRDSRELMQLFLEQSGARVLEADSAAPAFDLLHRPGRRLPDLILSDLAMPEEDGYSLIARIRKLPADQGGEVPAIALSAFATVESKKRALEAGFHRYATKPFDPDALLATILELLGK